MIKCTFKLGGEIQEVIVRGNELLFMDVGSGQITPLTGLKMSKSGVLLEFPDLKDDADWKKKAIDRLREHISNKKTEMDKILYVKEELIKFGYEPLHWQRAGHRQKKF